MAIENLGTASTAKLILAITAATLAYPTYVQISQQLQQSNPILNRSSVLPASFDSAIRETTLLERTIGEIRKWHLLADNWDGEGSIGPKTQSLKEAVLFLGLLSKAIIIPDPMLLNSGNAALFWNEENLYADIEFLGDGRIAYFIKKNGDKHKGVLKFDSQQMPSVFSCLLYS
jgi:hypothetical protein